MFKRILVIVDAHPGNLAAVAHGAGWARRHRAELVLFHALPPYAMPLSDAPAFIAVTPEEFRRAALAAADRLLSTAAAVAEGAGVVPRCVTGEGDGEARCVLEAVRKHRCDLVIAAAPGQGAWMRLLSGHVIPRLITASPVPVCVVRASPAASATPGVGASPVMVLLEQGDAGSAAVDLAIAFAAVQGSELLLVDLPPAREATLPEALGLPGRSGAEAAQAVALSGAAAALLDASRRGVRAMALSVVSPHDIAQAAQVQHCELIVLPGPGGNALMRLLSGNVVPMMVTESLVPVLVCPSAHADGRETSHAHVDP